MRQADQALMPPAAGVRARACGRVKPGPFGKNSEIYYPNDLCSPSRVLPVPGPGGAFGSDACIRVSAGHDVTAADVAFAVVRRVIKLACAVSESRVRARSAALRTALASS